MTLLTKGMGAILKAIKKGSGKALKKANTRPKTMKPFYAAVGAAVTGRQIYKKITGGQTDWGDIKDAHKEGKKRRRDASLHKGEK